jgi:hypothetical protein
VGLRDKSRDWKTCHGSSTHYTEMLSRGEARIRTRVSGTRCSISRAFCNSDLAPRRPFGSVLPSAILGSGWGAAYPSAPPNVAVSALCLPIAPPLVNRVSTDPSFLLTSHDYRRAPLNIFYVSTPPLTRGGALCLHCTVCPGFPAAARCPHEFSGGATQLLLHPTSPTFLPSPPVACLLLLPHPNRLRLIGRAPAAPMRTSAAPMCTSAAPPMRASPAPPMRAFRRANVHIGRTANARVARTANARVGRANARVARTANARVGRTNVHIGRTANARVARTNQCASAAPECAHLPHTPHGRAVSILYHSVVFVWLPIAAPVPFALRLARR